MNSLGMQFSISSVSHLRSAIADVQSVEQYRNTSDVTILKLMGVCPAPLFDAFTLEAYRLHQAISGGAPWPWSGTFYDQPAVFARAQEIIMKEQAMIRKEDERAQRGRNQTG